MKLLAFAFRRTLIAVALLIVLTFVTYVIFWQIPTDPACSPRVSTGWPQCGT